MTLKTPTITRSKEAIQAEIAAKETQLQAELVNLKAELYDTEYGKYVGKSFDMGNDVVFRAVEITDNNGEVVVLGRVSMPAGYTLEAFTAVAKEVV